jgi:hypothetical protein
MKIKGTMTKCPEKYRAFTRKCSKGTLIGNNLRDFLGKNAQVPR